MHAFQFERRTNGEFVIPQLTFFRGRIAYASGNIHKEQMAVKWCVGERIACIEV